MAICVEVMMEITATAIEDEHLIKERETNNIYKKNVLRSQQVP